MTDVDADDIEIDDRTKLTGHQLIENVRILIERTRAGIPSSINEDNTGTIAEEVEIECAPVVETPRRLNLGTVELQKGATWCHIVPRYPAPGIYCFPSGNFQPEHELGWKMKVVRRQPRPRDNGQVLRDTLLRCEVCGAEIRAKIGPFVTTLLVPHEGVPHKPH